jgi:anti-anti-sigma factor
MDLTAPPRIPGRNSPDNLHCWLETLPEAVVLHVEGDVDLATSPYFANAIAAAFASGRKVIVDFAGVSYIDGSGLGILKRAGTVNAARLALAGSSQHIGRLLDIVELADAVPVVATLEAGREYFRHGN